MEASSVPGEGTLMTLRFTAPGRGATLRGVRCDACSTSDGNQENRFRSLILDDERNIVTVLKAILEKRNFQVDGFTDPREALNALRSHRYEAAVTDLYMPDI